MTKFDPGKFDRTNALIAAGVGILAFVVYALTKAPTLSFWDCGEFVACSYILGIPHPPGTPLYILMGRLFSVLPIATDIAARVNYLSVVCSSFTAVFGYLIGVRVLRACLDDRGATYTRLLTYAGAASGALFLAWGLTNWNNSVEAEVYGMSMMLVMLIFWLMLKYIDRRGSALADRIMLVAIYLGFLGIGVHMTTFLALVAVSIPFVLKKEADRRIWFAIAAFVVLELFLVFAMSSLPGEIPYYVAVAVVFVCYLFYIFSLEQIPKLHLIVTAGFAVALLPMLAFIANAAVNRVGGGELLGSGVIDVFSTVGRFAFGILILAGCYLLFQYYREKNRRGKSGASLMAAGFILASGVLAMALLTVKGYQPFLFVSALLVSVLLWVIRRHVRWPILIALLCSSLVVVGIYEFVYGLAGGVVVLLILGFGFKVPHWKTGLVVILLAAAGFSIHLFLPVRSSQQPRINQNNPSESIATTVNYLERRQYGSQSMIDRMFLRRGEWGNQFGMHRRMGFWGFFQEQYGIVGPKFVIIFLIGVFGIWEVIRRRSEFGLPLLLMFIISSVGLILYMNFSDGTRQAMIAGRAHLEVRDRDYFFTPAFICFGLMIGIGLSMVIQTVREMTRKFASGPRSVILAAMMVLFLLPSFALANNYYFCDRSRNYLAYNYGSNILSSAQENAVLFTFGDNDTFPVWCLQEVFGVRPDVAVVNLTLGNMKWYVKQVASILGVNIGWSESEVDQLRPYRTRGGLVFRLQDQLADAIVVNNRTNRPINYSVTTPESARRIRGQAISGHLTLLGMTWLFNEEATEIRVDAEGSYRYFSDSQRFRPDGYDDPTIYKNETSMRMTATYANGLIMTAEEFERRGDTVRAEEMVRRALHISPGYRGALQALANFLSDQGRLEELRALIDTTGGSNRSWLNTYLARLELKEGDQLAGIRLLEATLTSDPKFRPAFRELMRYYYGIKDAARMHALLQRWLRFNPGDQEAANMLKEVEGALISKGKDTNSP